MTQNTKIELDGGGVVSTSVPMPMISDISQNIQNGTYWSVANQASTTAQAYYWHLKRQPQARIH